MGRKKAKATWKSFSPEKKQHLHFLARLRSADGQVKRWLIERGIEYDPAGNARKKRFRTFLEAIGYYVHGVSINRQIEAIYTDADNDMLGAKQPMFYYSPDWLCLRTRVIQKYGSKCMKCGSQESIAVDHIKPRSKFPELELDFDNMQVLCRVCNSSKSNRHVVDYRPAILQEVKQA